MDDGPAGPVVLLVDDHAAIRRTVAAGLELEGFSVVAASGGRAALEAAERIRPAVVLLDLNMPDLDGLEVLRRLREGGDQVPVCVLSARDEVDERVRGLQAGADDYIVKPFAMQEVVARVQALLRRRPAGEGEALQAGDLRLDPRARSAHRGERALDLTRREFELLEFLMRNDRLVVSRERLLDEVWGYDPTAATNTIDVFVSNLRRKLEAAGESRLLHTKRGAGYVIKG